MAPGQPRRWPVVSNDPPSYFGVPSYYTKNKEFRGKWGRHFGTAREDKDGTVRRHAGVDLAGNRGDVVVAMQPGELLVVLPFYNGTEALYQLTEEGVIINYGEIEPGSPFEFIADAYWKLKPDELGIPATLQGRSVPIRAGDPIARIGHHEMLHAETYRAEPKLADQIVAIRNGHYRWLTPEAPSGLLDPTEYLVKAELAQNLVDDDTPKVA
jgi:hypothetical protein